MPLTPVNLTAAITVGLLGGAMLGPATPKLALGIGTGLMIWVPQLTVLTTDTGAIGAGVSAAPFLIPPPLLIGNMVLAYIANGQLGPMAPLEAVGLGLGLATGFAQGLMISVHAGCGSGVGLARVLGPPAFSSLMQGFASADIKGTGAVQKANAISTALQLTLQAFGAPVPIAGAPGPSPGGGVGIGKIV